MAGLEIQKPKDNPLLQRAFDMIVAERRGYPNFSYDEFDEFVRSNIKDICEVFNTRWLISVCDTYAGHPNKEKAAGAMIIITIVNMIKLWGTDLCIRDKNIDEELLQHYKRNQEEIWDGVITFKLAPDGDMLRNMIKRQSIILETDEVLSNIFKSVLEKCLSDNRSPLYNLITK